MTALRFIAAIAACLLAAPADALEPGARIAEEALVVRPGVPVPLRPTAGGRSRVIVFMDAECPVSQRYAARLAQLAGASARQGHGIVVVDVTPHAAREAAAYASRFKDALVVHDRSRVLAARLAAQTTAEAFVIDRAGTLRYRGAIDDQYGIDHQRPKPTASWLSDALAAIARDDEPQLRRTQARGCPLGVAPPPAAAPSPVTYHGRISRILQRHCLACHREGGLGPMPLERYEQVAARRAVIEAMVAARRMPPWSAEPGVGHWANDRSLREDERRDLLLWLRSGVPEGEPAHAPVTRKFDPRWNIGKPDFVTRIPEPMQVPAHGMVDYRNVYIKTDFPTDRWVTAVEIRPTQPRVVHHALMFIEEPGRKPLDAGELAALRPGEKLRPLPADGVREFFAANVPGSTGTVFPAGMGKRLPKGAWLRLELHYQPNGTAVTDRTEIAFRFAGKPLLEIESRSAFNTGLVLKPHAAHHEVRAEHRFETPGMLTALFPHMHFRGKAFRFDLRRADGRVEPLLSVPRFDFNWQSSYQMREPLAVAAGDTLLATAWFDNSRANPWNPDPAQEVRWGTRTIDEMMIGYFDFAPR